MLYKYFHYKVNVLLTNARLSLIEISILSSFIKLKWWK